MLVLASNSSSRRAMLAAAGVPFEAHPASVDEDALKQALGAQATPPRDIADALAELKAMRVSQQRPTDIVLGSDSLVVLDDGTLLDKPRDRDDAAQQLRRLSSQRHRLISAAVMAEGGAPVWRYVDTAELWVRPLSDHFIADYLEREWPAVAGCVGCYRLEAHGVQLFARIAGSHFTILGLPLLPVLEYLRVRGLLAS